MRGKAKLQRKMERKSKVTQDGRWENKSDYGCSSRKAKSQRMFERKAK